jgi:NAD(P)-dependent dehydrogenase (short-subunit alcohol dehydrogenase family)
VVVVAGGTGGLGKSVSLAFLEEGAQVIVTYRKEEEFQALKNSAGQKAPSLEEHQVDVTDEVSTTEFITTVARHYEAIDVLVNTIGGYSGGVKLWELATSTFDQMFALNLRSGYVLTRAVMPIMLRTGHGSIVNVAAKAAFDHASGAAAYAASKAAAVALMDSLAADTKGTGVRVNSVLPSIIDTTANRLAMPEADFAAWPKPQDIARSFSSWLATRPRQYMAHPFRFMATPDFTRPVLLRTSQSLTPPKGVNLCQSHKNG